VTATGQVMAGLAPSRQTDSQNEWQAKCRNIPCGSHRFPSSSVTAVRSAVSATILLAIFPSRSISIETGTPRALNKRTRGPLSPPSNTCGHGRDALDTARSNALLSVSMETPTITNPRSRNSRSRSFSRGNSPAQMPHQEAQKFSKTVLPRRSFKSSFAPPVVWATKCGVGWPVPRSLIS